MSATPPAPPRQDGEVRFDGDPSAWAEAARAYREGFGDREVFGLRPSEVRREADWPSDPVVLSAHQPVLFHPGLWVKALGAGALAGRLGWTPVHKVTDQDAPGGADGWVPEVDVEGLEPGEVVLSRNGIPYALQGAPKDDAVGRLLATADRAGLASVHQGILRFGPSILGAEGDWDDWHLGALRSLDTVCGTKRSYHRASRVWGTEAFRRFLSLWLLEPARYGEALNRALGLYRSAQGIHHPLTPVPDLAEAQGWWETPFWTATGDRERDTLWVQAGKGETLLRSGKSGEPWVWSWGRGAEAFVRAPWKLYPKALPQSLFTRLFLADFMFHGLGGGFYEPVNDLFLRELGETDAAPFATLTATCWLEPEEASALQARLALLERLPHWRRALEKNPEYLVTREGEWDRELPPEASALCRTAVQGSGLREAVAEKQALLEALSDKAARSEAGRKLRLWNEAWVGRLGGLFIALDALRDETASLRGRFEALSFREYAYFCYPPARWTALNETVDHRVRKG